MKKCCVFIVVIGFLFMMWIYKIAYYWYPIMLEDSNGCYLVVQVPVEEEIIHESIILRGIRQGSPFKPVQMMAKIYGRLMQNGNGNITRFISGPLC